LALLLNKKNFKLHIDPSLLESYNKTLLPVPGKQRIILTKEMADSLPKGKHPDPDPKLSIRRTYFTSGVTELIEGEPGEYRYEIAE